MNPEEEAPTRVTRGALRRRSIDQDVTLANPQTTGTGGGSGTPKKAAAKKGSTLGPIQESQGRPSTPVVSGRVTRRRISESSDTPTTATNKVVQSLKDSDSVTGSGRRSRNTSLTLSEENINKLNEANETTGTTGGRTRTPARLRASHETLTNTTPQTVPVAVRRSTRRNSVTSDDGSVQSLPITTPKTPVVRTLMDETIVEEETSGGDRSEPETTPRTVRRQSGIPVKAASESPRREAASPLLSAKKETTPQRGSISPKPSPSALRLPNSTPRSKNVSFSDEAKQDDEQSAYPKTPTTPGKKFILVEVNDLRNSSLINGAPKANAEVELTSSVEKDSENRHDSVSGSPNSEKEGEKEAKNDLPEEAHVDDQDAKEQKAVPSSPAVKEKSSTPAKATETPSKASVPVTSDDRSVNVDSNNMSGINALESSMVEEVIDTSTANGSNAQTPVNRTEGEKFSKYWSHSVRGRNSQPIDAFNVSNQEEQKQIVEEPAQLNNSSRLSLKTPEKMGTPAGTNDSTEEGAEGAEEDEGDDEEEGEEEEERERHELIDDEAMEVEGYQSGDSMDSETRREIEENEMLDRGEDLGSQDTEEEDDLDGEDENDSFIVSDGDEDELLAGTDDDLTLSAVESPVKAKKSKTPTTRQRIIQLTDDSEDEAKEKENKPSTPSSTERNTTRRSLSLKRSAQKLRTTDEESSPEKKPNRRSEVVDGQQNNTPKKTPTKEVTDEQKGTPKVAGMKPVEESPAKSKQSPGQKTPSKVGDVSTTENDSATTTEGNNSLAETNNRSVAQSRKSLPASSAGDRQTSDTKAAVGRKSLPAGTKMQFTEEPTTDHSSSNLEEETQQQQQQQELNKSVESNVTDTEVQGEEKTEKGIVSGTSDDEYFETSDVMALPPLDEEKEEESGQEKSLNDDEQEQPASGAPVKPGRKSLPAAAPLISAQFYLGGSKKEKRNTIAGGEGTTTTNTVTTSTPNQKKAEKAKKSAIPSNLVANPFALASAKARARMSMDPAIGGEAKVEEKADQKEKKNRHSLPTKLNGVESGHPSEGDTSSKVASTDGGDTAKQDDGLEPPEPMEVDEYIEEEEQQGGEGGKQSEPEVTPEKVEKQKKTPKKKKALEDFDIDSILTRCNEVVRADKERKKQAATALQQKRDEKRRLRALREQQEKEAATNGEAAGGDEHADGGTDDETGDANAASKRPNVTTTSNNETTEQSTVGDQDSSELKKKKKKRKPKIKNYLLEEMAEIRKDHVSEALLRKMEAREARKQRKKERLAAKMKLLNKENGNGQAHGAPAEGIGAKLQKVAAKKKQLQLKEETAVEGPKQPVVKVAISAFSVFQQLQNTAKSPKNAKKRKEQKVKKEKDGVAMTVEVKMEKQEKDEPKKGSSEKPSKENRRPAVENGTVAVAKATTADNVSNGQKDSTVRLLPKSASDSELQNVAKKVPSEKEKRAQEIANIVAAVNADLGGSIPKESEPLALVEEQTGKQKSKSKKNKAGKVNVSAEEKQHFAAERKTVEKEDVPESLPPKEKKVKKQIEKIESKQSIPEPESLPEEAKEKKSKKKAAVDKAGENENESIVSSAIREVRAAFELAKEKKKKPSQKDADAISKPTDDLAPSAGQPKKRKRDLLDASAVSGTPRPTKLRALQRADQGFIEETVTPEKTRLKRNFGFEELQATPKAVGFKVSSLLPSDDLRTLASDLKAKVAKKKKQRVVPEPDRSLPLPVWTRSGYFLEVPDQDDDSKKGKSQKEGNKTTGAGGGTVTDYIPLKDHKGFKLQTLRNVVPNGSSSTVSKSNEKVVVKPHRIDPNTVAPSVVSFKRQQLLEKTAHLREKKGGRK